MKRIWWIAAAVIVLAVCFVCGAAAIDKLVVMQFDGETINTTDSIPVQTGTEHIYTVTNPDATCLWLKIDEEMYQGTAGEHSLSVPYIFSEAGTHRIQGYALFTDGKMESDVKYAWAQYAEGTDGQMTMTEPEVPATLNAGTGFSFMLAPAGGVSEGVNILYDLEMTDLSLPEGAAGRTISLGSYERIASESGRTLMPAGGAQITVQPGQLTAGHNYRLTGMFRAAGYKSYLLNKAITVRSGMNEELTLAIGRYTDGVFTELTEDERNSAPVNDELVYRITGDGLADAAKIRCWTGDGYVYPKWKAGRSKIAEFHFSRPGEGSVTAYAEAYCLQDGEELTQDPNWEEMDWSSHGLRSNVIPLTYRATGIAELPGTIDIIPYLDVNHYSSVKQIKKGEWITVTASSQAEGTTIGMVLKDEHGTIRTFEPKWSNFTVSTTILDPGFYYLTLFATAPGKTAKTITWVFEVTESTYYNENGVILILKTSSGYDTKNKLWNENTYTDFPVSMYKEGATRYELYCGTECIDRVDGQYYYNEHTQVGMGTWDMYGIAYAPDPETGAETAYESKHITVKGNLQQNNIDFYVLTNDVPTEYTLGSVQPLSFTVHDLQYYVNSYWRFSLMDGDDEVWAVGSEEETEFETEDYSQTFVIGDEVLTPNTEYTLKMDVRGMGERQYLKTYSIFVKPDPYALTITAPETASLGQDVTITVSGVPEGETVTIAMLDQSKRIVGGKERISDGTDVTIVLEGYNLLDNVKEADGGKWSIQASTTRKTETKAIRMNGTPLQAPTVMVESVTESETERQAVIGITSPEGADRIQVFQVFFGMSGAVSGMLSDEYELVNGQATIATTADYKESVWAIVVNARVDGVWTQASPVQFITTDAQGSAPTVTVSAEAVNPERVTITAPGWNGAGCLIMMTTQGQLMEVHWSLTFVNGVATAEIIPAYRYQGDNVLQAVLFEGGRVIARSAQVPVTYTGGTAHEADDYYMVNVSISGSLKAGNSDAVSLDISTADQQTKFGADVYDPQGKLVWGTQNAGNRLDFPMYVFNSPGEYTIECYGAENHLMRTVAVTIEENSKQPKAATVLDGLMENNGYSYVRVKAPESGAAPDGGWYYEIIPVNGEWGTPSRSTDQYNTIWIRADLKGTGAFRIRACQIRNSVCGPWGYGEFTYAMNTDGIEVVVPDPVTFGEDYVISTPTEITGSLPVYLRITDEDGEGVYFEVDQLNTRRFEMDGSLLPAGTYTATITAGTTVSGSKEFTVTGSGPEKPTLTADKLLLTEPGTVTFTVNAPEAESVYLSEGGTATESFDVVNGKAEITISFSMYKNGKYTFYARAQVGGVNSLWSDPLTIEVRTNLSDDNEWSDPTYSWSEDRKSVSAERHSLQDQSIVEKETVDAAKIVVTSPGKTTAGKWQEVSKRFTNRAFAVQFGEEGDIPALDTLNALYLPAEIKTVDQEALFGTNCEAIIVPDGCSTIAEKAFANNRDLIYLRLPASVKSIPTSAIEGCPDVIIDWAK